MSGQILDLGGSADEAIKFFRIFESGTPDIVSTGLGPIDRTVGGLFPGSAGILAAHTGLGKSSIILSAALSSQEPVGIVSIEDTPDVWGSRALSWLSKVDSLRIRTKRLSELELKAVSSAQRKLSEFRRVSIAYEVGGSIERIVRAIEALADRGCRLIWVDYLQKIRGISDDRRNEVGMAYTAIQRVCADKNTACMVVSQFSRQIDQHTKEPQRWWLKESGDLENEARMIVLGWRDKEDYNLTHWKLDKCTFGGEGLRFSYRRDESGSLKEYNVPAGDF